MRFRNKVSPTSKYFPPAGPANAGHGAPGRPWHSCSTAATCCLMHLLSRLKVLLTDMCDEWCQVLTTTSARAVRSASRTPPLALAVALRAHPSCSCCATCMMESVDT